MIYTNEDGRRFSQRTKAEKLNLLKNEIGDLSEDERRLLLATMKSLKKGNPMILRHLNEQRYRWSPVSIEEWLDDPYHMGMSTKTLYPKIREDLIEALGGNGYREIVLTGSIGYGKTTFMSIAICRILYELSCMRAPQLCYGLSPGSEMAIALVSVNLFIASKVMLGAIQDKLEISQYFNENFPHSGRKDELRFPNNISLYISSTGALHRLLGLNVIAAAIDEANFMSTKRARSGQSRRNLASYDNAESLYNGIVRRIKSRFMKAAPDLPGCTILTSSANLSGGFLERKLDASKQDPTIFARDYATWDVKPQKHFCGERFLVGVGEGNIRSKLIEEEDEIAYFKDNGCKVVEVPIEYRDDFERDLEMAIRDIAGLSTFALSAFISRIEKIEEAIVQSISHPCSRIAYKMDEPFQIHWHELCVMNERRLRGGYMEKYWIPKNRNDVNRVIHIDTSLSGDSTGFAMGYVDRMVEVQRRDSNGQSYTDLAPKVVIEFMLRIDPPSGDQIFLPDVRRLVYEFQEHGFHISSVTCDSYQSAEMLQQMRARGINAKVVSLDRTTEGYDKLKSALYEDRISYYHYEPFLDEVKKLEYHAERGKIDHPIAGSKDISDAVAGVVLILSETRNNYTMLMPVDKVDNSSVDWVTDGKVQWNSDKPLPQRKVEGKMPLPIILG